MEVKRDQVDTKEKNHINVPTMANTHTSCAPATMPRTFYVGTHSLSPHL